MGAECGHETCYSINSDRDGNKYWAKFGKQPFSQGESRYAFKGTLVGKGPRKGDDCVIKVFKREVAKSVYQWIPDLAASTKSITFAEKFNSDFIPTLDTPLKRIDFLIPLIAKMYDVACYKRLWIYPTERDQSLVRLEEYVTIEPFLKGNYEKFNSNCGYEDSINELLPAFSHWTWAISDHQFMVCDLQGIETDNKFILTDPAVHSLEQKYGMTDMGVVGMEMVLAKHACNRLCAQLGLQDPMVNKVFIQRINTMYRWQLSKEENI